MSAADDDEFWSDSYSAENIGAPPPSGGKPGLWAAALDRQRQNLPSSFSGDTPWLMTPRPSANKSVSAPSPWRHASNILFETFFSRVRGLLFAHSASAEGAENRWLVGMCEQAAHASARGDQGLPSSLERARANSASFFKSMQHEFPTRSPIPEDVSSISTTSHTDSVPATCLAVVDTASGGWGESLWELSADLNSRHRLPSPAAGGGAGGGARGGGSPPGWGAIHGRHPPAVSPASVPVKEYLPVQGLPGGGGGAVRWRERVLDEGSTPKPEP